VYKNTAIFFIISGIRLQT